MTISTFTKIEAAYIAGIVDSDGSIGLQRIHGNDLKRTTTYVLRLRVTNTHKGVIEWLRTIIGLGTISLIKKEKEHYKQGYSISWSNKKAIQIIRQIYPYMIIKRRQAELAFEFEETLRKVFYRLPDDIIKKRQQLRECMIQTNTQ